ncbi:MAG: NAD(+) diphosphatase [Cyanobacteria bacterium J06621_3]
MPFFNSTYPPNPFAISDDFVPATTPRQGASKRPTWWFLCCGSKVVVCSAKPAPSTGGCVLPQAETITDLSIQELGHKARTQFLGYLGDQPCIAAEITADITLPAPFCLQSLRSLHGELRDDLFAIAARAVQLVAWDRNHQFCSRCGTSMVQSPNERTKRCPSCQLRQYPQLSPAVIMLIYKSDQVLLARAPRFRPGMYSVLAGFVEPGESLEETVIREVREEVGVEIKNIQYFGSQPWPFPKSLMIGFIAEYASGSITPDPAEIEAAQWFHKSDLPPVPGELSIARKLIDWFVQA